MMESERGNLILYFTGSQCTLFRTCVQQTRLQKKKTVQKQQVLTLLLLSSWNLSSCVQLLCKPNIATDNSTAFSIKLGTLHGNQNIFTSAWLDLGLLLVFTDSWLVCFLLSKWPIVNQLRVSGKNWVRTINIITTTIVQESGEKKSQ